MSLTLTDEKMPYQARERLDLVFPNLLELKVENLKPKDSFRKYGKQRNSAVLWSCLRGSMKIFTESVCLKRSSESSGRSLRRQRRECNETDQAYNVCVRLLCRGSER